MEIFKNAYPILLPSDYPPIKGDILLTTYNNKLKLYSGNSMDTEGGYAKPYHLYITSDDKIQEGDNIYTEYHLPGRPETCISKCINIKIFNPDKWKKIIATTDNSLKVWSPECIGKCEEHKLTGIEDICRDGCMQSRPIRLPQPTIEFIEEYIEEYNYRRVINNILVEYEGKQVEVEKGWLVVHSPKTHPVDNTITIKREKNIWNKSEVRKLILKYNIDHPQINPKGGPEFDEWIKDNL